MILRINYVLIHKIDIIVFKLCNSLTTLGHVPKIKQHIIGLNYLGIRKTSIKLMYFNII